MFSLSARFADALTRSHTRVVTAEIWTAEGRMAPFNLDIVAGNIQGNSSDVRTTMDLTVASRDGSLVPQKLTDPLAPFGSEVVIRAGIQYTDGSIETAPMGRFRIVSVEADQRWSYFNGPGWSRRGTTIHIAAQDRMIQVLRSGLMYNMSRPATAVIVDELRTLVSPCIPVGTLPADTRTIGGAIIYDTGEGSRMASVKRIMPASWFYQVDRGGVFTVYDIGQTPSVQFSVTAGVNGYLLGMRQRWTSENFYNGVLTSAQNASDLNPIKGLAVEQTPPVWWGGAFGYVPLFKTGLPLTTQQELDNAAAAYLANEVHGRYRRAIISIPPDPRIDIGDGIKVTMPDYTFIGRVVGFRFPLVVGGGSMEVELEISEPTYVVTVK